MTKDEMQHEIKFDQEKPKMKGRIIRELVTPEVQEADKSITPVQPPPGKGKPADNTCWDTQEYLKKVNEARSENKTAIPQEMIGTPCYQWVDKAQRKAANGNSVDLVVKAEGLPDIRISYQSEMFRTPLKTIPVIRAYMDGNPVHLYHYEELLLKYHRHNPEVIYQER